MHCSKTDTLTRPLAQGGIRWWKLDLPGIMGA
jgi:hypothetical protein